MHRLLQSALRNATQVGYSVKDIGIGKSLQRHLVHASILAKSYSTEVTLQKDISSTDDRDFKGHDMLAPFTAGWQTTDLNPLIIEKSEGSYVYDINGKKYLDALAGLWCTALGGNEPCLVEVAMKQLNTLPFYHSFWNRTTRPSLDLAKELLEMFTASKMAKAFFTNSGSEANDTQDKVQNHINTMIRANGGSLEGIDMSKAYMETVGTIKGNVYGLGSWGQTLINNGVNASTTSSTNQDEFFKNLKEELEQQFRTEMETLKAQMEAQVQSQVQSQVQEVMLALFRFGSYPPAANDRPSL